ncbi:MAG: DUF6273 domain-containing protein [Lachnospiraceae bacterium]|nr:DUF6273 domain-containing protein [Lachnospiraceae bacterium]MDD3616733.1 DUF6273 domain-containing protein [Lachnospiraceae bacterium]
MGTIGEEAAVSLEKLYSDAVNAYIRFVQESQIGPVKDMFEKLGDYKDSAKYLEKCENFLKYNQGNTVTFGKYQDKELVWKVILTDGNRRMLLAEKPVEHMYFYPEREEITWSNCTLRRWLNKQFLEESFTLQERMMIILTPHQNNADPRWYGENGPDTRDKAFVFNLKELDEYLPNKEDRAIGEWWWLRGHGSSNLNQHAVYDDGTVYTNGVSSNSEEVGVRPAMWIRLGK